MLQGMFLIPEYVVIQMLSVFHIIRLLTCLWHTEF